MKKICINSLFGHISQLEKQNKAEKLKLKKSVKEYISRDKHKRNMECIKKAKELIFDDSSYGRQLLRWRT